MHLARRVEFDSQTTNELLLADCHSYMDDRSGTKAPHLEQLPLWKTRPMEMRLWTNPSVPSNGGRHRHIPTHSLVTDEVLHPIGKVQPLLIGLNHPDQVESSLTGVILSSDSPTIASQVEPSLWAITH